MGNDKFAGEYEKTGSKPLDEAAVQRSQSVKLIDDADIEPEAEVKHQEGMHDQANHGNRFGAPDDRGNRDQTHVGRSRLQQVIRGMRVRDPAHDAEIQRQRDEQLKEPKKPAKYPGSKQLHKQIDEQLRVHRERISEIQQRIDVEWDKAEKLGQKWVDATKMFDSAVKANLPLEDRQALEKRVDEAFLAYNVQSTEAGRLRRERDGFTKEANAKIIETLAINNEVALPYKHGAWVSQWTGTGATAHYEDSSKDEQPFNNEHIAPAIDFACKMVNPELLGDTDKPVLISHGQIGKRESYWKNTITASEITSFSTIVHEMGHAIEDRSPEVHKSAIEFYEKRTSGEVIKTLNSITNTTSFEPYEISRKDNFLDPYMGKEYVNIVPNDKGGWRNDRYATELVSMGLQYLYEKPMVLYKEDPEYFDWIVNTIRGTSEDD